MNVNEISTKLGRRTDRKAELGNFGDKGVEISPSRGAGLHLSTKALDITILFRAISIVAVVTHHLEITSLTGGALFLLFLAGYNFVVFTLPKAEKLHLEESVTLQAFLKYSWRLYLPVFVYLLVLSVLLQRFHIHSILMISNYQGLDYADGIRYWFIEVLLQIILITGITLSLSKSLRNHLFNNSYNFFLVSSLLLFFVRLITWDVSVSTGLLETFPHQLPNVIAFVFFIGGLIACSKEYWQRVVSSVLIAGLLLVPIVSGQARVDFYALAIASLTIVWISEVRVFRFMEFAISQVAFSSLFIYLTHFQVQSIFGNFTTSAASKWLILLFSVLLGITGKLLWTVVIKRSTKYSVPRKILWA